MRRRQAHVAVLGQDGSIEAGAAGVSITGRFDVDGRLGALIEQAERRAKQQDFGPEAEQINRDIMELTPRDTAALNRLARCLFERGAEDEAELVFESVLQIDPENRTARRRLGAIRGGDAPGDLTPRGPSGVKPPHSVPVPPGEIDPTSESAADAVIQDLYPNEAERRQCLVRLASSIKLVRHLPADHWEITLQPRMVRLNVSKLAAVDFFPGKLRLLVEKAGVPVDVWNLSVAFGGPRKAGLLSASNLEWIDLPSNRLDELLPRCEGAHRKAVLQASEGGRSPYLRFHSPGVVAYLNTTLGEHIAGH
jgi:hypothetical protein